VARQLNMITKPVLILQKTSEEFTFIAVPGRLTRKQVLVCDGLM